MFAAEKCGTHDSMERFAAHERILNIQQQLHISQCARSTFIAGSKKLQCPSSLSLRITRKELFGIVALNF